MTRAAHISIGVAGFLILAWIAAIGLLFVFQRKLLYPASSVPPFEDWQASGVEPVVVPTSDGEKLRGYWKPPAHGAPVVVTFHGNGSSVVWHAQRFASPPWSTGGWGFLAIAYRGYPGSTGSPSEDGLLADGDAAVAFVEDKIPAASILFHGHSLGTAVAIAMAAKHPSIGLYLQAPFDSMTAVARAHFPFVPAFVLRDTFRSEDRISNVASQVFVAHGAVDNVVPIERGRSLVASARPGVKFVILPGMGHNNIVGQRDFEAEALFRPLAIVKPGIPLKQ